MTDKLFNDEDVFEDNEENVEIPADDPLKPFREKYKDDASIAKAILAKDQFIQQLKQETAGLRADLASRSKVEEAVDRLLSQNKPSASSQGENKKPDESGNGKGPDLKTLTEDDVKRILEQKEAEALARQNLAISQEKLLSTFGSDWQKVVAKKAKEIGESREFFDALAKKNPNALMALLGSPEKKPEEGPSLFTGGVNTTGINANTSSGIRDQKYYEKLRKENPTTYWAPATQVQMHKDAVSLRERFFT